MVFRELTMDDMKDKLTIKGSLFDILAATASRAKEIYESEQSTKIRDSSPPKSSRKRTATAAKFSDDEGSGSGSKKIKYNSPIIRYNRRQQQEQPAPPLPEEVKKAIEEMATEPAKLVIQKALSVTDLSRTHGRLSIPIKQIREEFLTEEEKRYFRGYDGMNKKYKKVEIFEPSLELVTAKFCQWDMKKGNGKMSSNYVINGGWNDIVRRNKLRPGLVLQVWGFRVFGNLGFALVRLPTN